MSLFRVGEPKIKITEPKAEAVVGKPVIGVSPHAAERIETDQRVTAAETAEALRNPLQISRFRQDRFGGAVEVTGEKATVVLGVESGVVITVKRTSTKIRLKLMALAGTILALTISYHTNQEFRAFASALFSNKNSAAPQPQPEQAQTNQIDPEPNL